MTWLKKIYNSEGIWQDLFYHNANINKCLPIWELDPKSIMALTVKISNPFWREVVHIWSKIASTKWKMELECVLNTPIWYSFFNTNKNILSYQDELIEKGCKYIVNLIDDHTKSFYTFRRFRDTYNVNINYLDYMTLINQIPPEWKKIIRTQNIGMNSSKLARHAYIQEINNHKKNTNLTYWWMIKKKYKVGNSKQKWEMTLNENIDEDTWKQYFSLAFKTTIDCKLRSLHFQILHRFLTVNRR